MKSTMELCLCSGSGEVLFRAAGEGAVSAALEHEYAPGDTLTVSGGTFLCVRLDRQMDESLVYAPAGKMTWRVPLEGDSLSAYPPYAFRGGMHMLSVRLPEPGEVQAIRDLACNPHDLRGETDFFPHATANVETRGEACFAARNVIDGLGMNHGHGIWPFQSWGIGTREDAALTVDFGREVDLRSVDILLRADFPHDSWFSGLTLVFSDGSRQRVSLEKTDRWQTFPVSCRTGFIRVEQLEKADDPSPFPSLRGLRAIGSETH